MKARITPAEEKEALRLSTVPAQQLVLDASGQLKHQTSSTLPNGDPLTNGILDNSDEDDVGVEEIKKKGNDGKVSKKTSSAGNSKKRKIKTEANGRTKKAKNEKVKNEKSFPVKKKPSGMDLFLKKVGKPLEKKNAGKKEVETVVIDDDDEDDNQPLSSRFHLQTLPKSPKKSQHSASSRKSTNPKKKKQATLLELTKKGSGIKVLGSPSKSVKSSPSKPRKPRQPLIVLQLMSLKKEKTFRVQKYKCTVAA